MAMNKLTNGDIELNYIDLNSNKTNTIVFIHGNSHSLESFAQQMNSPELQKYRLIFLDLAGHGNSPRIPDYTLKNLAESVAGLCKKLTTKNIVIAGHSLGGHVAINTLKHLAPNGLFLFGTPPLKNPLQFDAFAANENSGALRKGDADQSEIESLMNEMNYSGLEKAQAIKDYLRTDPFFRETILDDILSGQHEDELNLIKTFTGQVMFLLATRDSLINNNYIREELGPNNVENCLVKEIPAGHSPHVERPLEFNRELADFCDLLFEEKTRLTNIINERDYGEQRN